MTTTSPAPDAHRGKTARRIGRLIVLLALVVTVSGSVLLTPWAWRFAGGDATIIEYQRMQRAWRASWGLPLPGAPALGQLQKRLAEQGLAEGAPVLVRIFKREFELELWMKRGRAFQRFAVYPVCTWSGALGPKLLEGDRQTPEGFYSVEKSALNPNSQYHRSFNIGYPNAHDQMLGRTGSLIMVHGGCASIGCFAMTNEQIDEIWRLVSAALDQGQRRIQVQVYPFRMTSENLDGAAAHPSLSFWRTLKKGNDMFEASLSPPRVLACGDGYHFEPAGRYPDGDGGVEARCPAPTPKNS